MSTINNGGPAFPVEFKYGDGTAERAFGMSLRDYFAAKVMQAAMTNATLPGLFEGDPAVVELCNQAAVCAYKVADAMLKARDAT